MMSKCAAMCLANMINQTSNNISNRVNKESILKKAMQSKQLQDDNKKLRKLIK